jgi:hypothetical protein
MLRRQSEQPLQSHRRALRPRSQLRRELPRIASHTSAHPHPWRCQASARRTSWRAGGLLQLWFGVWLCA